MINFREITEEDAAKTLRWRTSPRISSMMLSDIDNNIVKQTEWIKSSRTRPDYYHWIFQKDADDAGLISIWALPEPHLAMNIGFYIGEERLGFIALTVLQLGYFFIFNVLGKKSVELQIHEDNRIIRMQEYLGFKRKRHADKIYVRNGREQNFLGFSLSAADFFAAHPPKNGAVFPVALRGNGISFEA